MIHRRAIVLMASGALAAVAAIIGCSSKSNPTSPAGGGGNTPFDSGSLTAPASFEHVFPDSGSVGYHCTYHRAMGMVGTVVVTSTAASAIDTVTASGTSFTPATVHVRPGGKVHWTIAGGTHTVTSD